MTKKQTTIDAVSELPAWLSPDALRQRLIVDTASGEVRWRVGRRAGDLAGVLSDGYRFICLAAGKRMGRVGAHQIVWAVHHGRWPELEIDHRNRSRADNRIDNLRLATPSQNQANSTAGPGKLKGTTRVASGRWRAQITVNCRTRNLGTYDTELEAHAAYMIQATQAFGEYARAT
jgi:hypothetical protein